MMKEIKSGLNTMKTDAESEFRSISTKRDAVNEVLNSRIKSAQVAEKSFSDATIAFRNADKACTSARNDASTAAGTLTATTTSLKTRNPLIVKELQVIEHLLQKVEELKSINLQESSGQESARTAAYQQTRDMIESLQTFGDEAAPLSEMIQMAREHAEFTGPIVTLLKQLQAKLLAEQDTLHREVKSAQAASDSAASTQVKVCEMKEAKKLEEYVFCAVVCFELLVLYLTLPQGFR
jgi:hypothetical protein